MFSRNIGAVLVKDVGTGLLLGILTDRDLVLRVLASKLDPYTTTVAAVMTSTNVAMIYDDANLMNAERMMIDRAVRRLIVLRRTDNQVVGLISVDDIAMLCSRDRAGEVVRGAKPYPEGVPSEARKVFAPADKVLTTEDMMIPEAYTLSQWTVREVMSVNVEWVQESNIVAEVATKMLLRNVGCLPVCTNDSKQLSGILTDRDLVIRVLAQGLSPEITRVGDIMSSDVACCFADDSLADAQTLLVERGVRRLPVLDRGDNQVVGILSVDDIAFLASRYRAGDVLCATARPATDTATVAPAELAS